ncbi:MAG TPA: type II secretion system protein [Patescibacteria group bacterium]|nr:type II secretion system protein [Patescibacteria group bacterium]
MKIAAQIKKNFNKGFTLIELLVVIGILGILAAALVATIDPFEQLNKATDSNTKNVAVEFLNAGIRYYTTHSAFPWDSVANGGADCMSGTTDLTGTTLGSMTACLTTLIGEGELKSGFTTATGIISKVIVNENGSNVTMCFKPVSKAQQRDANAKFNADGTANGSCPGGATNPVGPSATCYWCTQ